MTYLGLVIIILAVLLAIIYEFIQHVKEFGIKEALIRMLWYNFWLEAFFGNKDNMNPDYRKITQKDRWIWIGCLCLALFGILILLIS